MTMTVFAILKVDQHVDFVCLYTRSVLSIVGKSNAQLRHLAAVTESSPRVFFAKLMLLSLAGRATLLPATMSTVIVGAGIIGTSTAYYLSQSKTYKGEIHLLEASPELFASASGYAAGFLARDWFSPRLAKLGALSFDLHKQLAEENDGHGKWGYSRSSGTSLEESVGAANGADWLREGASRSVAAARTENAGGSGPSWLQRHSDLDVMSDGSTTAQV